MLKLFPEGEALERNGNRETTVAEKRNEVFPVAYTGQDDHLGPEWQNLK